MKCLERGTLELWGRGLANEGARSLGTSFLNDWGRPRTEEN